MLANYQIQISEVMSDALVTLHPKDKASRAKEIFNQYDIHHIPIVVMKKVVGVLSMGDLLIKERKISKHTDKFLSQNNIFFHNIEEFMTENPITIDEKATLKDALELLTANRINCLPVVANNEIKGIVTSYDILVFIKNKNS